MDNEIISHRCFNTIRQVNAIFKHEVMIDVAHKVNQHLSATVSYVDGCLNYLNKESVNPKVMEALKQAAEQTEYAGQLIHDLKTEYQGNIKNSNNMLIDINLTLKHILNELKIELAENKVKVEFVSTSSKNFSGNLVQIAYALWNIIDVVIHAQQRAKKPARLLNIHVYVQPDNIVIDIGNIDAEKSLASNKQGFTSVITAKFDQKTMMELNVVEHILEAHYGKLLIQQANEFTLFRVQLPA